ncbi:DUF4956 domain-containing protein [bacterium]|nr:MAG: DUF4956 domain-containing protein [bacterium]
MGTRIGYDLAAASMLLAFGLSMTIAWIYTLTYEGIGYLRSFVQTLAMGGIVAALVMLAIGDDVARGLGMVGALTLIRFRATLKDTRDLVFVFASLAVGVACGVQAFAVAAVGTGVFLFAVVTLFWSEFGSRRQFDAVLRFRAASEERIAVEVRRVLAKYCRRLDLIDLRSVGANEQEFSYHLKLSRKGTEPSLLRELEGLEGVDDASMFKQDATLEL